MSRTIAKAPETEKKILFIDDVAAIFKVHRCTVSRLVKLGKVPCHKFGKRVYFLEDEINAKTAVRKR